MRKVNICPGVYMVYIDEMDLRILCGCPMDVVKLLTRKGVIHNTEKDGVQFETGPNAILLSDLTTQNGEFCNLIEFPLLHMQYKQGMSLPLHPNNIGYRPLLIGLPHQIHAQCHYFIRGKYGLISVRELMEAGFERQQAIDLMRLKMRFNYGRLQNIAEQFDLLYIENNLQQQIRAGLYVQRTDRNVYQFTLGDELVRVDLNLSVREKYDIPYHLDRHMSVAEDFAVTHLGEGNGWDVDRASMSSLLCYRGRYFLVDAPPGVDCLLNAAGISINDLEGIFHTHSHDDHFGGLTSLIRSGHRLKYFATKAVRYSVIKKLSAVLSIEESMFVRMFHCFDLEFDQWNNIDGLEVMPLFSPHPVETSIFYFRVQQENNCRIYGHLADTCSDRVLREFLTDNPAAHGIDGEFYSKIKQSYLIPADLKKIDIGGGLIHGDAIDFKEDISSKIVLCHLERPLDDLEKEIGISVSFAMTDVLIPTTTDLRRKRAESCLKKILPQISDLGLLLNGEILQLKAGTIIIEEGNNLQCIYLLLTGVVSGRNVAEGIFITLNIGSLVGSSFVLLDKIADITFRAETYVSLLKIPKGIYLEILHKNRLLGEFVTVQQRIDYLQSLELFWDGVSGTTLCSISRHIRIYQSEPGERIHCHKRPGLYILFQGSVVETFEGNENFLFCGDIFGKETVLPNVNVAVNAEHIYKTVQKATIYHIPAAVVQHIPVIQWKLMEMHNAQTNRSMLVRPDLDIELFGGLPG